MHLGRDLAIQSYCLRGFKDNATVAGKVRDCDLDRIELCGVHVDFRDEASFTDVLSTYHDAGIRIVSIGVEQFADNEARERKLFEFARRAGCPTISADFAPATVPACYRTAEKLAEEYDINLAIHNHGGRHWLGSAQSLEAVFQQTGPRIGLMLDTAWAQHSHEDPVELATRFADRLYGLHVKDFMFDSSGQHRDVVVGTGNLDLASLDAALAASDFAGAVILEYEGDVEDPIPALRECVEKLRAF